MILTFTYVVNRCIMIMEVKTMPTEKPRYTITLDEEMLKAIDDFRFERRYPNRTQATLELIRLGMESLKREQQEAEATSKDKGEVD